MTANPLKLAMPDSDRAHPPKGNGDEERAARIRFWIEHGNSQLAMSGRGHLQWVNVNGHYFVEPR